MNISIVFREAFKKEHVSKKEHYFKKEKVRVYYYTHLKKKKKLH